MNPLFEQDPTSTPEPTTDGVGTLPTEEAIINALREVFDPEIPVNIYDLGLIYAVHIEACGKVLIDMTLTAPGCPVAHTFPQTVEAKVCEVDGVTEAAVTLVWDPPWTSDRMSQAARLELNMF